VLCCRSGALLLLERERDVFVVERADQRCEFAEGGAINPEAGGVMIDGREVDAAKPAHGAVVAIVAQRVPGDLQVARPRRPGGIIGSREELRPRFDERGAIRLLLRQLGEPVGRALPRQVEAEGAAEFFAAASTNSILAEVSRDAQISTWLRSSRCSSSLKAASAASGE
jgi:hypothetical protein